MDIVLLDELLSDPSRITSCLMLKRNSRQLGKTRNVPRSLYVFFQITLFLGEKLTFLEAANSPPRIHTVSSVLFGGRA